MGPHDIVAVVEVPTLTDALGHQQAHPCGRNFGERLEHETPLTKPRVRDDEAGLVDDGIAKQR